MSGTRGLEVGNLAGRRCRGGSLIVGVSRGLGPGGEDPGVSGLGIGSLAARSLAVKELCGWKSWSTKPVCKGILRISLILL